MKVAVNRCIVQAATLAPLASFTALVWLFYKIFVSFGVILLPELS
jgi:hypothetical protein